ncbi:unnamed protein product [Owenia fusiformis]|uniref:serine--tRNA ligase n=1 Tax=Owenia fusiformis TaxID=6347 RepID=A0A8J1XWE9_OWEFU|nr:unnamed protein product [Owenia fusiformis]
MILQLKMICGRCLLKCRALKTCLNLQRNYMMKIPRIHGKIDQLNSVASLNRKVGITLNPSLTCQPHMNYCMSTTGENRIPSNGDRSNETDYSIVIPLDLPEPTFDWLKLCDPRNTQQIEENIKNRKGVGDIYKVIQLWKDLQEIKTVELRKEVRQQVYREASQIPNESHPESPIGDESNANVLETVGEKKEFDFAVKSVVELGEHLDILRTSNVTLSSGPRTYYFKGALARLEQALVRYTVEKLLARGFQLISVPDLIHPSIIEGCGFSTTGERTQVYRLNPEHGDICLAGTAEMALAGLHMNKTVELKKLPMRLMAVSRCYRAETSSATEERDIYRVHQFTKVEMFGLTEGDKEKSGALLREFKSIQKTLFSELGLHFRVLDMPTHELGAPAYRKFDIETWMPHKQFWGEISSSSNCTDFQTRRLHTTYKNPEGKLKHVHTVNGTACAIPRMIMALVETNQNKDGTINIPEALQTYMGGDKTITKSPIATPLNWLKLKE